MTKWYDRHPSGQIKFEACSAVYEKYILMTSYKLQTHYILLS